MRIIMEKKIINLILLLSSLFIASRCLPPRIGGDGKLSIVGKNNIDIAYGFDIKNNYAFLGTNTGLLILDISNREKPLEVTELELGFIRKVTVIDRIVYLCGAGNGLIIVDVSDVKKPQVLGRYQDHGEIYGFAKSGSYAYICDRLEGIKVIDIQDPSHPKKISQWTNGGQYWEIEIRNDIAYVADVINGLELIDISDPNSLSLITTIPNTKGASSVQIEDKKICLGSHHGVKVFEIENPRAPQLIMSTLDDQEVLTGYLSKNLLFAGADGISVFDVTTPNKPIQLANWTITGGVHGIIYDGQYIYTAKLGFYILTIEK